MILKHEKVKTNVLTTPLVLPWVVDYLHNAPRTVSYYFFSLINSKVKAEKEIH